MLMPLMISWFPIVIVAGLGGRLIDHQRSHWLGLLCAVFWGVIALGSADSLAEMNAGFWMALIGGAAVIVAIGSWATNQMPRPRMNVPRENSGAISAHPSIELPLWMSFSEEMYRFDDWLNDRRERSDLWDEFDEYVRSVLSRLCHSTHVRPYRTIDHATGLVPLRAPDVWEDVPVVSSTEGLLAQVMHSKSRFLKSCSVSPGDMVENNRSRIRGASWCFPVLRSGECIGVIEVGTIDVPEAQHEQMLTGIERLIGLFWNAIYDSAVGAHLGQIDPVSGLPTREAFLQSAQCALKQSYDHEEPVAMVIVALERLRYLSDSGRWESVDEIVRLASDVVRKKIRTDDCPGRFDESRMVVLLRRVDAELATLVATQLVTRLEEVIGDNDQWGGEVEVRCGVVSAGAEQPDIRTLLSSALSTWRSAHKDGVSLVSYTVKEDEAAEAIL